MHYFQLKSEKIFRFPLNCICVWKRCFFLLIFFFKKEFNFNYLLTYAIEGAIVPLKCLILKIFSIFCELWEFWMCFGGSEIKNERSNWFNSSVVTNSNLMCCTSSVGGEEIFNKSENGYKCVFTAYKWYSELWSGC